jgi:basic membrane protein A
MTGALALTAAACGSSSTSTPTDTGAAAGSTDTSTAAAPTTAAKTFKVGLVTDVGGLNDKGFNMLANQGLEQAKTKLGITGDVKESKAPTDYIPNLSGFAQSGYDMVIAVGFLMADSVAKVAAQYPSVKFAIVDSSAIDFKTNQPVAPNLTGLLFKEQEAGYLVGTLVGAIQKAGGLAGFKTGGSLASVGGIKIPPVDRYIAGFQAGAQAADPGIKTLNGYSGDFAAQAKCKELATSQIAQGADVVFQVAGGCGLGALQAAKDAGVWGIGVDTDQSSVNEKVIASAIKKVDAAVLAAITGLTDGSLGGGTDMTFGVAEDGVGIAGINAAVPQAAKDAVDAALAAIKSGSITIPTTVK